MSQPLIRVVPDAHAMVAELSDLIIDLADRNARAGQMFSLFLSGGSTPKSLYQLLASEAVRTQIDWRGVELYFGDERCVPPDSELSNYRMAHEALIRHVPIPPENVYRMKGEIDPEAAASEYGRILRDNFMDQGPDLLLLGMGDDGHTASLFPGTVALHETEHRCVANHVPHDYIPAGTNWRLTLTYPFINRSQQIAIMVTGESKAQRVQEVLEGEEDIERLPIQGVKPDPGTLTWYLDVAAAGMNQDDE
jgi:6-phosphogluconolactonase